MQYIIYNMQRTIITIYCTKNFLNLSSWYLIVCVNIEGLFSNTAGRMTRISS